MLLVPSLLATVRSGVSFRKASLCDKALIIRTQEPIIQRSITYANWRVRRSAVFICGKTTRPAAILLPLVEERWAVCLINRPLNGRPRLMIIIARIPQAQQLSSTPQMHPERRIIQLWEVECQSSRHISRRKSSEKRLRWRHPPHQLHRETPGVDRCPSSEPSRWLILWKWFRRLMIQDRRRDRRHRHQIGRAYTIWTTRYPYSPVFPSPCYPAAGRRFYESRRAVCVSHALMRKKCTALFTRYPSEFFRDRCI